MGQPMDETHENGRTGTVVHEGTGDVAGPKPVSRSPSIVGHSDPPMVPTSDPAIMSFRLVAALGQLRQASLLDSAYRLASSCWAARPACVTCGLPAVVWFKTAEEIRMVSHPTESSFVSCGGCMPPAPAKEVDHPARAGIERIMRAIGVIA